MINTIKYYTFFFAIVFILFAFYNIPQIINFPAQGAHLWRQADGLAMVWNYKLFNLPFLQTETFNLLSTEGKGIAEFPIFYFFAAQFVNPEKALRILHFVVLVLGFFAVYRLAYFYLRNNFYTVAVLLLFASSPLIIFYGINFIIDVPALCFSLFAWSVWLVDNNKKYSTLLSLSLFSFAALLKAVHVLNFIVLFYLLYKEKQINFKNIVLFSIAICIPTIWYFYAKWYNHNYHNDYLFLSIQPIFMMSFYDIGLAIWRIIVSWSATYFWRPTSVILIVVLSYYLLKKEKNELSIMIVYTFVLDVIFALLFLEKLIEHEYYYPIFYINIVFVLIGFLYFLQKQHKQNYINIALLIFIGINLFYCKNNTAEKQTVQRIDSKLISVDFQNFLNKNQCTQKKTVFCYDDFSVNQSLYAIKRKGITQYNENWKEFILKNKIDFVLVSEQSIDKIIKSVYPKNIYTYKNYKLIAL
ncbi:MAG TPA: hypothetical protein PKN63_04890 [Chitinophagales bacterium]|nr:hypothetical protein [Chitinophagales bacterium]